MWRTALALRFQGGGALKHRPPRRATYHAVSDAKSGKDRFDLAESLRRDREAAGRRKSLPWRSRLSELRMYPWKFFVAFMLLWSWLGTYVVPYVKGMRPGELPSLGNGRCVPQELQQRATPMPRFKHLEKHTDGHE
ncbi:hypothetical protein DQ04_00961120 [Trypanosoma grayi]|uniref:hypothetical protein n=1 Tax=Trypanosoma grayi TaxID=71804 RepID=UPI0004F48BAC|nr:hypothetical protein DQ04_00961120 [Trypanosoma grayi]KEG13519.1 hypothetical protein DQ04_00961120 [Trypanosoma grayi]